MRPGIAPPGFPLKGYWGSSCQHLLATAGRASRDTGSPAVGSLQESRCRVELVGPRGILGVSGSRWSGLQGYWGSSVGIAGWALEGFFMGVQLSGTVIDGRASRDTVGVQLCSWAARDTGSPAVVEPRRILHDWESFIAVGASRPCSRRSGLEVKSSS